MCKRFPPDAEVTVLDRIVKHGRSSEQGVDDIIQAAMLNDVTKTYPVSRTLVLLSGDGNDNFGRTNFPDVLEKALMNNWSVEVWAWRSGTSHIYEDFRRAYGQRYALYYLDDHADYLLQEKASFSKEDYEPYREYMQQQQQREEEEQYRHLHGGFSRDDERLEPPVKHEAPPPLTFTDEEFPSLSANGLTKRNTYRQPTESSLQSGWLAATAKATPASQKTVQYRVLPSSSERAVATTLDQHAVHCLYNFVATKPGRSMVSSDLSNFYAEYPDCKGKALASIVSHPSAKNLLHYDAPKKGGGEGKIRSLPGPAITVQQPFGIDKYTETATKRAVDVRGNSSTTTKQQASTSSSSPFSSQSQCVDSLNVEEIFCALSHQIMTDPVTSPQGYHFQRQAILDWLSWTGTCPITNKPLSPASLKPNSNLSDIIREYRMIFE